MMMMMMMMKVLSLLVIRFTVNVNMLEQWASYSAIE